MRSTTRLIRYAILLIASAIVPVTHRAQTKTSVCDPTYPQRCAAVSASSTSGGAARQDVYTSDTLVTGTITSTQSVTINTQGRSNLRVSITGTWEGTIVFEGSVDGTNWVSNGGLPSPVTLGGGAITPTATANGTWEVRCAGLRLYRMRGNTVTSGSASVAINASAGSDYAIANLIDDAVSIITTVTPLGAGGAVSTGTIDMKPFVSLDINFVADVPSATNGCVLYSSVDGENWVQETAFTYDAVHPEHLKYGRRSRYMRFQFTNGATPQGSFQFQAFGQRVAAQNSTVNMGETLDDDDTAVLTRSVITGRKTTVGNGYENVTVDENGSLNVNTGNLDDGLTNASAREVFSLQEVQVSLLWPHGLNTRIVTKEEANGGTVVQNISGGETVQNVRLSTSTNVAGSAILYSNQTARFTSQQAVRAMFSTRGFTCVVGNRKAIGVGLSNIGYFVGCDPVTGQFGVMYRNTATGDHWIPRASFNGYTLDGTVGQPTSEVWDPTNTSFFFIDYRMGTGTTQFFLQFPGKEPLLLHELVWRNSGSGTSVAEGFLPLRVENANVGSAANNTLLVGPMALLAEAGSDPVGVPWAYSNRKNGVADGVLTNLFTLRNNATWNGTGGPVANRVRLRLQSVTASVTGGGTNATAVCQIQQGATLGGVPAYADMNANDSIAATDVAGTTVTGGAAIAAMALVTGGATTLDLIERRLRLNPGETWTFACMGDGATVDIRLGASWVEEW